MEFLYFFHKNCQVTVCARASAYNWIIELVSKWFAVMSAVTAEGETSICYSEFHINALLEAYCTINDAVECLGAGGTVWSQPYCDAQHERSNGITLTGYLSERIMF